MSDQEGSDQEAAAHADPNPGWIARRVSAFKRNRHDKRTAQYHESAVDRASRRTATATIAIAILTAVAAGAAISQYIIFDKQLAEMKATREGSDKSTADQLGVMRQQAAAMERQIAAMQNASVQAEKAIAATNRMAEALAQANVIAKQGTIGVQRAFIIANGIKAPTFDEHGSFVILPNGYVATETVKWENIGNTPTKDLRIKVTCRPSWQAITDPDIPKDPLDADFISAFGVADGRILAAKQQLDEPSCTVILNRPPGKVYYPTNHIVFGRAIYRDIVDPAVVHLTEYCGIVANLSIVNDQKMLRLVSLCPVHNCTDNECSKGDRAQALKDYALLPALSKNR